MRVLITGAAGNLGSNLSRHMLDGPHELKLLIHHKALPFDVSNFPQVSICRGDLEKPNLELCENIDCIVHFAGVLFAPNPENFLETTNVQYVKNLADVAIKAGVKKFILISFPHVEGESTPENPARGLPDGNPNSVHAKTRLAAEQHLVKVCEKSEMIPVILRPGMIYARGILMIDAARWLARSHLLAVWKKPTWIHLISLPDFLECVVAAIEIVNSKGIYNLGDEEPVTLQTFLDLATQQWGYSKPWRFPTWLIHLAGWGCEVFAKVFRTASPLTRDFIKIGMVSYYSDITRMKQELRSELTYPTLQSGLELL